MLASCGPRNNAEGASLTPIAQRSTPEATGIQERGLCDNEKTVSHPSEVTNEDNLQRDKQEHHRKVEVSGALNGRQTR